MLFDLLSLQQSPMNDVCNLPITYVTAVKLKNSSVGVLTTQGLTIIGTFAVITAAATTTLS